MKRNLIVSVAVFTVFIAVLFSFANHDNYTANENVIKTKPPEEITSEETQESTEYLKATVWSTKITLEEETTASTVSTKTTTEKSSSTKKKTTKKETTTKKPTTKKSTTKATIQKVTTAKSSPTVSGSSTAVSVVTQNDLARIREGFLTLVNHERAKHSLKPLVVNSSLNASAKTRSQEITRSFSHTRPNGKPFHSAINKNAYPYSYIAENIQKTTHIGNRPFEDKDLFMGRDDQIVEAYTRIFNNFKNSPEHYEHLTDSRFTDTGIGISYTINPKTGMSMFYIVHILGTL